MLHRHPVYQKKMLHRHRVYQKRMLHRHRVYVPSAGAGGCAIRSLVGTTAPWEEQVEKDNVKCWPELKILMRNALNMHRERIATCQLTLSPGNDVPLLRLRSRECSTAILYTSRECSTAILYTRRECFTAIVYTYPVLESGDAL